MATNYQLKCPKCQSSKCVDITPPNGEKGTWGMCLNCFKKCDIQEFISGMQFFINYNKEMYENKI